ncbi:MAG: DVUA0089 family protein [Planctomycetota bacterium]
MRSFMLYRVAATLVIMVGCAVYAAVNAAVWSAVWAQDKPAAPDKPPRIALANPLAVMPGSPVKVVLRGWDLEQATEIRSTNPRVQIKLLGKGKAAVPNKQDAKQVGDTQLEFEVTVPAEEPAGDTKLTVVGAQQESAAHILLIGSPYPRIVDTEPNDGFRQAQVVQFPQVVDGQIHGDQNVDLFVFELAAPQQVVIEVLARHYGSGLDSLLTLFSERGVVLAAVDDTVAAAPGTAAGTAPGDQQKSAATSLSADARIERMLPAGKYFVCLQDAFDHGGVTHPYRLIFRTAP